MNDKKFNGASLIVDGKNAMDAIIDSIKKAKKTIKIRMFMWRDDDSGRAILKALQDKIDKNPEVMIYIEKDAFGKKVYDYQKYLTLGRIGGDIFSAKIGEDFIWKNSNVIFNSVGYGSLLLFALAKENNHSKVFLFDENTPDAWAIIGGMNITDECLKDQDFENPEKGGWHDYMVMIGGKLAKKIAFNDFGNKGYVLKRRLREGVGLIMALNSHKNIRKEILSELSAAKKSVIIEHGYLTDHRIIRKLRKLSRRGVKIKVILPMLSDGVWHANMQSLHHLLKPSIVVKAARENLEAYLYNGMIHAKVMIIDEKTTVIGSANLTHGSFDLLKETNAIFRQKDGITLELLNQIEKDLEHCTKARVSDLPKYNRILAWIQKIFI